LWLQLLYISIAGKLIGKVLSLRMAGSFAKKPKMVVFDLGKNYGLTYQIVF